MTFNQPHQELIDLYLRNELSSEQLSDFQSRLESDADFSQQVKFEQQVANGLKEYRKAQLKARLDLIEVSPAPYSTILGQSSVWKVVSGVLVASTVGLGIYYYNTNKMEPIPFEPVEVEVVELTSTDVLNIPSPVINELEARTEVREATVPASSSKKTEKIEKPLKSSASASEPESVKEFSPIVDSPDLNEVFEESFRSDKVSMPEISGSDEVVKNSAKPISVETFEKTGIDINYKYFEGKLFLFGDFKKEPYEILEINSKSDRALYLYFSDQFYKIESTTEIKTLKPILEEAVIKDLNIIRSNKTD